MSNAVTHAFSCGLADDAAAAAAGEVVISNWNAQHTFAGATANGQFLIAASGETTGVVWTGAFTYATPNLSLLLDTATLKLGNSSDVILARDAANALALRNSTAAQQFNLYNTYTDVSNYERLELSWSVAANVAGIRTAAAGTGTSRVLRLYFGNTASAAVHIPISSGAPVVLGYQPSVAAAYATGKVSIIGDNTITSGTVYNGLLITAGAAPTSTSTMVQVPFAITPTINYSNATPGAGSYEALKIAVTATSKPTGQSYLMRVSEGPAGTTDIWRLTDTGHMVVAQATTSLTPASSHGGIMGASDISIFRKADKMVFAYASGNVMNYLTCNLDGSTTTWVHGTATPS